MIRPPTCIMHLADDTMCCCYRLCLSLEVPVGPWVMEGLRVTKLTATYKLKISNLVLLLSIMDRPLLRYTHVFRIMQNAQEKFTSGMLYVLTLKLYLVVVLQLVNQEMFWVVTEICQEPNPVKRMKIIKQFIKVARKW